MQALFWIGLVVLMLGITSLLVPIPRNEQGGLTVGGVSVESKPGITKRCRRLSVWA
jgi:hypothetical protein